jgi:hypothetical protein
MRKKRSDGVVVYNSARGRVFRIKYRDADGKQIMETAGAERDGMTRAEAAKLRRARVADVDKGWRKPAPLTFETAIAEWFASAEIEKAWKPRTVYAYRGIVARLNDTFGRRPLAEIEPGDVVAYKGAMLKTHGPYSVSRDLVILHQFFKWALIAKGLRSNPAQGVPHPRLPKWRGQALAPELVQALLRAFEDGQDRCVFLMLHLDRRPPDGAAGASVGQRGPDREPATRRRLEDEDRGTLDCAAADARRGAVAAPPPQPLRERPRPRLLPPDPRHRLPRRPSVEAGAQKSVRAGRCDAARGDAADARRRPRHVDHERCACERARLEAAGTCGSRELRDDAALHRPCRRRVPR